MSSMNEQEYNEIAQVLKGLGLEVFEEEGFFDFINYKEKEHPFIIYGISKNENGSFSVSTLFGMEDFSTVEESIFILKQDWNPENWIHGEDDEGEYVELKPDLPIFEPAI